MGFHVFHEKWTSGSRRTVTVKSNVVASKRQHTRPLLAGAALAAGAGFSGIGVF